MTKYMGHKNDDRYKIIPNKILEFGYDCEEALSKHAPLESRTIFRQRKQETIDYILMCYEEHCIVKSEAIKFINTVNIIYIQFVNLALAFER